jgi:hypothetical protein
MRVPVSGGSSELVLNGVPDQDSSSPNFLACPLATASCVLTEQKEKEVIFYALDPLKGKGKELARSEIKPQASYGWDLSPDGSEVAVVSGLGTFVRTIDLKTGLKRDVPVPSEWDLRSVGWAADGKGGLRHNMDSEGVLGGARGHDRSNPDSQNRDSKPVDE